GEPGLDAARSALAFGEQLLEHLRHASRVDAGTNELFDARSVGLPLVVTTELCEHRGAGDVDARLRDLAVADVRQHTRERDADVGALHLLHLLHGVPEHDVTDLVTQYGRELVHLVRALDHAAIHIDESARQRERVEVVAVYKVEMPVEIGPRRHVRELVAENVEIPVDLRILDDRQLGIHLRSLLLPHLHLLLLAHATGDERSGQDRHFSVLSLSSHSMHTIVRWSKVL